MGGVGYSRVTYYENATTLCDGHPRVSYSPAVSLSEGWLTTTGPVTGVSTDTDTVYYGYSSPSPTCQIAATDCEPLLTAYTSSLNAGRNTTAIPSPPCVGVAASQSIAAAESSIYGCGKCTIYGEGVELVYFPTTASRDMCASTPTASLTHYGPSAVITAYAGKSFGAGSGGDADGKETAVVDGHTFTSGTAYISISLVSAVDRCSKTFGTVVSDAILALPSESVLSLRYSQDHFQRLMETDQITGYPVSYADFNTPVPWSAWNGMVQCDPNGYGGYMCDVIYDGQFRPQLAIPPQITDLSPDFKGCQMWYNGLWDPPLALQPAESAAMPTLPNGGGSKGSPTHRAEPASTADSPAATATALPEQHGSPSSYGNNGGNIGDNSGPTLPHDNGAPASTAAPAPSASHPAGGHPAGYKPSDEPWTQSFDVNGMKFVATGENGQVHINKATLASGGPAQTVDGVQASYGADGLVIKGSSTAHFNAPNQGNGSPATHVTAAPDRTVTAVVTKTTVVTCGTQTITALQSVEGGPIVCGSTTLTPGGPAYTADNGQVLSAGEDGLVVNYQTTVGKAAASGGPSASGDVGGSPDVLTYGGKTITEDSSNGFSIAPGQSLTPGGMATVSGTTLSLDRNGDFVVINGVTQTLANSDDQASTSASADRSATRSGSSSRSSASGSRASGSSEEATGTSSAASTATGSAAAMSSSQALSFFVALVAVALLGT